jgi:hypothetical protein
MDFSTVVLGTSAVERMQKRLHAPVLVIGKDVFSRTVFAHVECFHFQAAQTLSAILKAEYPKLTGIKDLYDSITPQQLALPRLGVTALAVLGAAFQAKGLGGTTPLESWVRAHLEKDATLVSFTSIKARDEKEHREERQRLKARKAARRNRAHSLRVKRFTTPAGAA